ncbi:non-hydrolyzing UDP-N-acetylglucosamine 2-epimerase [Azospirillum palustre]
MSKNILCIVGTRPEAIKMAPVISTLKLADWCAVRVIATAQHRDMLDQSLGVFGIEPDIDLNLMAPNQSLADLTIRALAGLDRILATEAPSAVLAQGDTTTVLATALACFYRRVPFCHVEAGLRTFDMSNPFPEEFNRVTAGQTAALHFAPTEAARQNLLKERIPAERILVTGNTVIDALLSIADGAPVFPYAAVSGRRLVLVTLHRRENFGEPLQRILSAILRLASENSDVEVVLPVHPNPNVKEAVHRILGRHERITLISPLDYLGFVSAMKAADIILSDSGGVQEEAPALGKPILVLRDTTERPEAIAAGVARLVGSDPERIVGEAQALLRDPRHYRSMAKGGSPYGDGRAAGRIADALFNLVMSGPVDCNV